MEKVFLIVEQIDENGETDYAIQYTGVMDEHSIYAKLTQDTGCPYPEYIMVSKKDTVDATVSWQSIISGKNFRNITISYDIAMKDSRIKKEASLFSKEILEAIDSHIQENEQLLATLLKFD